MLHAAELSKIKKKPGPKPKPKSEPKPKGKPGPKPGTTSTWNRQRVVNLCTEKWPNSIDSSIVGRIENQSSPVELICLVDKPYHGIFTTTGKKLLASIQACPECQEDRFYSTAAVFIEKAIAKHGPDKFIYTQITDVMMDGKDGKLPIICAAFGHKFNMSPNDHCIDGNGCAECARLLRYTFENVFERLKASPLYHLFRFHLIQPEHIVDGVESKIPLECIICDFVSYPSIHNFLSGVSGCKDCSNTIPYNAARVELRGVQVHGHLAYCYIFVQDWQITNGNESSVLILCLECGGKFWQSINNHINARCGCPGCSSSKGERDIRQYLTTRKIEYGSEFKLDTLPGKRYDFVVHHNGKKYLIEFDGIQHFEFTSFFHEEIDEFYVRKKVDLKKTKTAIENDYIMVRIDHTYKTSEKINGYLDEVFGNNDISKFRCTNDTMYADHIDYIFKYGCFRMFVWVCAEFQV